MASILTSYLASFLAWHLFWHFLWHSFWQSTWHRFCHSFWHLAFFLIIYLAFFLSFYLTFYSGLLSGIYSDILSDWDLALAVEVRQPRSGAHHCGPATILDLCQLEHTWVVWCAHGGGVGVGWGGVGVITFMSTWKHVMLRCEIFSCTCTRTSCYAVLSSLVLAHICHATLWDLLLHLHTCVMLRCAIFSCTCTQTWCYAVGSSLAPCARTSSWDLTHFSATSSEIATIQQRCHFDASCSSVCLPRFLFGVAFLSVLPSRIVPSTMGMRAGNTIAFPCHFGVFMRRHMCVLMLLWEYIPNVEIFEHHVCRCGNTFLTYAFTITFFVSVWKHIRIYLFWKCKISKHMRVSWFSSLRNRKHMHVSTPTFFHLLLKTQEMPGLSPAALLSVPSHLQLQPCFHGNRASLEQKDSLAIENIGFQVKKQVIFAIFVFFTIFSVIWCYISISPDL